MKTRYATTKVCRYDPQRLQPQSNDVELLTSDYNNDYNNDEFADEFICTPNVALEPGSNFIILRTTIYPKDISFM